MADIQRYLDDILEAVYGEEVRGSIHDAIEIINDASEVVLTSGTAISSPTSSSEGFFEGSFYINTNTFELWKCVGVNSWQSEGVIRGDDGVSVSSISKIMTVGLVDTYEILFSDGTSQTYTVTNGNGISSIAKTATVGLVDTYTITYTDGSTSNFSVTNGADGIDGVDGEDGTVWYKGTALVGTGSGITGFPGNKNDFYLNSSTGYVYACTKTGGASAPDAAEWEYVMTLTGGGGGSVTVVDNLNSTDPTEALSANQGRVLNNKKVEKPASPNVGDTLVWDGTDWISAPPSGGGHTMLPDPTSTPAPDEADVVSAINGAVLADGGANDDVASLFGVAKWSNTMTKSYYVQGIAGDTTPIGKTGIGNWCVDGSDETGWITIPELIGIGSKEHSINITYDPSKSGIIIRGGYVIDDTTGKMCIKFANEISEADTHTAKIGIEITIKRTENNPVSF